MVVFVIEYYNNMIVDVGDVVEVLIVDDGVFLY